MTAPVNGLTRLVPGLVARLEPTGKTVPLPEMKAEDGFGEMLSDFVSGVNSLQYESAQIQQAFLEGEPVELHQVMVKAEEAGVAAELLIEIRNKLVEGYQQLIQMPL
ncbi:MAG TPA: flagellar hook-basal body complex protein FliE [candidate division Zixibacteria bacterium]|nr:flagellar hook-basal body complex protein FliE [candidate division Zixibacteria bacterium]MDD4917138.1 flagellar hook-basal body complex protein FliE [candidate division Zixibacteria bacterium]MDM7972678.1 flagellar hook-basal body complex protein FliE [candidate division Zixibacteria bacterium]HOD65406.1 flagellar hook-basal body complex protein FliE [candidate division Zixibacteria bacterium]HOZ07526.1 flagellar hook-basal body complex protein FliE [candidate division Zixibacteria bacteriu